MPTVAETAYPRLKNQVREKELTEIYTPTREELNLASQHTRKGATKLGFLVLLKTFQRLGYFVSPNIVPSAIVKHIAQCAGLNYSPDVLVNYESSRTRWRHTDLVRNYLSINPYQTQARRIIVKSMAEAAKSPKPRGKSPGWETGKKRNKKPRYPVVKKTVTRKKKGKKEQKEAA